MALVGASYLGNRFLSHGRKDLDRLADVCDYVVHTVSETDLTFHKAVLGKLFNESKKRKLEVWADPWGFGGVFGGEAISKFLLDHREVWQVMSNGRIVPAACLNRPEWRAFVYEWILTVRDMGSDVIFWDEPHTAFDLDSEWEGVYSCVCAVCQEIYRKQTGEPLPMRLNDQARAFRRDSMRRFLSDLFAFAAARGLKNALCLYAFRGHAEYDLLWKEAAALPHLDIFGCDPYWRWRNRNPVEAHVGSYSTYVVETAKAHKLQTQIWVQAMRLPSGTEEEIVRACQSAVQAGVTHVAAWSYDGGELLDTVLSENPPEVWKAVERAFRMIRETRPRSA